MTATAKTLADGLRVLRLLHHSRHPMTPAAVGQALGIERTKAYRLLNTLHAEGFVGQNDNGAFELSPLLGMMAPDRHEGVRTRSTPVLEQLSRVTGLTAHVSVAVGDVVVAVRVISPPESPIHVAYRETSTHPINRGAAGVVILANRSPEARAEVGDQVWFFEGALMSVTYGALQSGASGMAMALDIDVESSVGLVSLGRFDEAATARHLRLAKDQLESMYAPHETMVSTF